MPFKVGSLKVKDVLEVSQLFPSLLTATLNFRVSESNSITVTLIGDIAAT